MSMYLDWMQLNWNEWVVNYDFAHQALLAQNVQRGSRNWNETAREWFRGMQNRGMSGLDSLAEKPYHAGFVASPRSGFLSGGFAAGLDSRFSSVGSACRCKCTKPLQAATIHNWLRGFMPNCFIYWKGAASRAAKSQTPLEFASSPTLEPELVPAVREFTSLYAQARFGQAACDAPRLRTLLAQIRSTPKPR